MAAISASEPRCWPGQKEVWTPKWNGGYTIACENCPLGTQTTHNPNGNKYTSRDYCSNCPLGKFNEWRKNNGAAYNFECVTCPGNKTTEFRGSSDPKDCIDCLAPPGKSTWVKWKQTVDSNNVPVRGFYSRMCYTCTDSVYNYQTETCESCGPGYFSDDTKKCKCNAGWSGPDGGTCVECAAGKYESNNTCVDCEAGASSSGPGLTECTSCEPGKYQESPGQYSCLECMDGKTTLHIGAISINECTECPVGYDNNPDKPCLECPRTYEASTLTKASIDKTINVPCIQID